MSLNATQTKRIEETLCAAALNGAHRERLKEIRQGLVAELKVPAAKAVPQK